MAPTVSTPKATRLMVPYGATDTGSRKMPPPMMLPMTSAVATGSPKRRACRFPPSAGFWAGAGTELPGAGAD